MKDYKQNRTTLSEEFCFNVYAIVWEIPVGKVTTYGDIATLLGFPRNFRLVARALKQVPEDLSLPCHRVVSASGCLTPGWEEQKELLLAEGIYFRGNGTIDMEECRWRGGE